MRRGVAHTLGQGFGGLVLLEQLLCLGLTYEEGGVSSSAEPPQRATDKLRLTLGPTHNAEPGLKGRLTRKQSRAPHPVQPRQGRRHREVKQSELRRRRGDNQRHIHGALLMRRKLGTTTP